MCVCVCGFSPDRDKKAGPTLTGRAPKLCGWALCPGRVLLLSSVAGLLSLWLGSVGSVGGLCVQALSSSCSVSPELCGWSLWLGYVSRPCGWALCPGLVLLLSSVARLYAWAFLLSSSCPCLARAPELCGLTGEECGRTNSDVNADKNSLMKQFALGVNELLFGVYACLI